jgi:hypothetical protein
MLVRELKTLMTQSVASVLHDATLLWVAALLVLVPLNEAQDELLML